MLIIRRVNCTNTTSGICPLCRWPFGMQVGKFLPDLHTGRSPTQSDIYQMYWYNWLFWWWTRSCSKHVENRNKYIQKGLCVKLVIYRNYTEMHGHQNIKRWPHALASLRHQVRQYCSREFDSRYSYGCLLFLTCYHVFLSLLKVTYRKIVDGGREKRTCE